MFGSATRFGEFGAHLRWQRQQRIDDGFLHFALHHLKLGTDLDERRVDCGAIRCRLRDKVSQSKPQLLQLVDMRLGARADRADRRVDTVEAFARKLSFEPAELEAERMRTITVVRSAKAQEVGRGCTDEERVDPQGRHQRYQRPAAAKESGPKCDLAHCVSTSAGPKTSGSSTTTLTGASAALPPVTRS